MLTEKDYCDYDTCVALKELGITDCSLQYYEKGYPNTLHRNLLQPLTIGTAEALGRVLSISLYNAQKWLREEKNMEVNASFDKKDDGWIAFIQRLDYPDLCGTDVFSTVYNTYESALLVSIKEAVKILKDGIGE